MSEDPNKEGLKPRPSEAEAEADERKTLVEALPYEVGFGKPPKHTRFRPGQSGNKKGRPKGSVNFGLMLDKELGKTVEVSEHGRRRRMPKIRVGLRQLINKAAAGDLQALNAVQQLMARTGRLADAEAGRTNAPAIDQRDLQALSGLLEFFKSGSSEDAGGGPGNGAK